MRTNHAYNRNECSARRAMPHRSPLAFACMLFLILCFPAVQVIAASESASTEPNAPKIAEPNNVNATQAPAQDTDKEPNQPSEPTIDETKTAPAGSKSTPGPTRRDWLIAGLPRTDLARKIWKDRITVPQEDETADRKKQLRQLIDRIRSIEFKPPEPPVEPIVVLKQPPPVESDTNSVEPADQNQPETEHTLSPESQAPTVSEETLNILLVRLQKPELLKNPFELGEILFNAGRLKEAAVCYRQALTRIDPNEGDINQRRPWTLFQIGNCLRKDEPTQAIEAYSQLITEHGGSLWAEPAKAQAALIAWQEKEKPKLLIQQSRPKPVETDMALQHLIKNQLESKTEQRTGEQTQDESQS